LALTKFDVKDTPAGPNNFYISDQSRARREFWRTSVSKQADESVAKAVENGYKGSWEKNSHNSASVVWLDAVVGEWVDWLSHQKLLDKTLLVFTADHGLMGKRTCNEHGVRIPMIFRGPPQLLPRNKQVHHLVALHDLAATFLHVAQSKPPTTSTLKRSGGKEVLESMSRKGINAILDGDGVSMWPTLGGQAVHDAVYCEIGYDRAAIGLSYKYITRRYDPDRPINSVSSHRSTQQFYNLTNDPNELENLMQGGELKYHVVSKHQKLPSIFNALHERLSSHLDNTRLSQFQKNNKSDLEFNKMKDFVQFQLSGYDNVTLVNASIIDFFGGEEEDNTTFALSEDGRFAMVEKEKRSLPISAKREKEAVDWLSVG
jgi:hypothetical protein